MVNAGTSGRARWLKRMLWGLVGLALVVVGALGTGHMLAERKRQRHIDVAVSDVPARSDAASVARGAYLYASRGCTDCHGADGAGKLFIDEPNGLRVRGANITPAAGSAVATYQGVDWVRTIRHGVKPDGRPALVMPSEDYNRFTDHDLAALVAYVRQLPARAGPAAEVRMPLIVELLYAFGMVPDAAERIDHTLPPSQPVAEAVTPQHGAYVATMCIGCHGPQFSGGRIPGSPPDWPAAANLTPGEGSAMLRYTTAEQFRAMLASGKRPDGAAISGVMPFTSLRAMNQVDADALYLYLRQLPPVASGSR
jgi:mono/diheme cytochrome c family protein